MIDDSYEKLEAMMFNLSIAVLFIVMFLVVRDVLNKDNVPKFGKYVTYFVLFFGCAGFIFKGVAQFFM